jgi:hypothetical protein
MNLKEFDEYRLTDAIKFRDRLNPIIFDNEKMDESVREQLLEIADDFIEHLGIGKLDVKDITLSGSNAAYTYTPHSDIDLHILVDIGKLKNDDIYRELFNSKKIVYNDTHDIKIGGYDVELYVQDTAEPVKSLGEYSVLRDKWIKFPSKRIANFDEAATREKFIKLVQLAQMAIDSRDVSKVENLLYSIKKYRQSGLDRHGEFGPENLAYKALRSRGIVDQLYKHRDTLHSIQLSLDENSLSKQYAVALESASGYIPSYAEKNDPRYKTGLTVDVKPDSIKKNAKKLGLGNIMRSGVPPIARTNGKT